MALALESRHPSYRPTFEENIRAVLAPFEKARQRFPDIEPLFLTVREMARMGRSRRLTEEEVVQRVLEGNGDLILATLEDTHGTPVNGNSREAAIISAPGKRLARRISRWGHSFEDTAAELGRGRLRLRLKV